MNPDNPLLLWSLEVQTNHWHVINNWRINPRPALCGFKPKFDASWKEHEQLHSTDRCGDCIRALAGANQTV